MSHKTQDDTSLVTALGQKNEALPPILQSIVELKSRRVYWITGAVALSAISIVLTFILGQIVIKAIAPDLDDDSVARVLMLLAGFVGIFAALIPANIYHGQLNRAREAAAEKLSESKYASQLDNYLQIQ